MINRKSVPKGALFLFVLFLRRGDVLPFIRFKKHKKFSDWY